MIPTRWLARRWLRPSRHRSTDSGASSYLDGLWGRSVFFQGRKVVSSLGSVSENKWLLLGSPAAVPFAREPNPENLLR